jgi:FdhE protein
MSSAQDRWIESHPYLRNVAEFQQTIAELFTTLTSPPVPTPDWKLIFAGYGQGVPMLESLPAESEYSAATAELLLAGNAELLKHDLTEAVATSAKLLQDYLQDSKENRVQAIEWVESGDLEYAPPAAGLLRVLAWAAIRRTMAPVLKSFAELRKDEEWVRAYCPVCGALPPLAHVLTDQPRTLACCYCLTSWQFQRIGCPFCGNDDQNQLSVLTIEQEPLFRLDACGACHGYLKTYLGGSETNLYLSDWSTLHLDLLARENKLERKGASLYEI